MPNPMSYVEFEQIEQNIYSDPDLQNITTPAQVNRYVN